nr:hypothetical protein [Tanacetum cinerariifolium]
MSPLESDLGRSRSLPHSLEKLPQDFSVEVEEFEVLSLTLLKTQGQRIPHLEKLPQDFSVEVEEFEVLSLTLLKTQGQRIPQKLDKFEGHDFRRWQKKMHFLLTTLKDSLESKYMAEDSSSKKFLVSTFNNYKMVDPRPVMEQYNELLRILGQYTQHGLKMDESISVSKDSLRAQDSDKGKGKEVGGPSVNMTEESGKNKHHKQNKVVKRTMQMLVVWEKGLRTNPKTKWIDSGATTHVCKDRCRFKTFELVEDGSVLYMGDEHFAPVLGKGSVALEFSSGKTVTLFNVLYVPKLRKNLVSGLMLNKCEAVSLISEAFYVQVDAIAWWIDTGATTHVCKDHCWFKTFEPVEDGYMGDEHFALVHGNGSVALEFSFGKTVTLFNVFYVPKRRKNLVSGPVLNKCGYKQVYESDKYILSKCGVFVGFGYYNNGHVHYKIMLEMSKDDLIHAIDENPEKCTT